MERLVIIGGGMAAARLINRLTELAPDRYAITLVGDEPSLPYDRVQLSSVLAGERSHGDLGLMDRAAVKRVLFFQGQRVRSLRITQPRDQAGDAQRCQHDCL